MPGWTALLACRSLEPAPSPIVAPVPAPAPAEEQGLPAVLSGFLAPPPSRCRPQDEPCVDLSAELPLWTPAPGHSLDWVSLVGDVNGDGWADAKVDSTPARQSIVLGPLARSLVLPDDEDIGISGSGHVWADVTGDGTVDLLAPHDPGGAVYFVQGPLAGIIDPVLDGVALAIEGEVDEHGLYVHDTSAPDRVQYWTSSEPTLWGVDPPAFTVEVTCCPYPECERSMELTWQDDFDGDGHDELQIEKELGSADCASWLLPGESTGDLVLPGSGVVHLVDLPQSIGDQNGDGYVDVVQDGLYLAGPVEVTEAGVVGAPLFQETPVWTDFASIGADLDGDGYLDFRRVQSRDEAGNATYAYLTGGPGGGLFVSAVYATTYEDVAYDESHLVEGGIPYVLSARPDGTGIVLAALP